MMAPRRQMDGLDGGSEVKLAAEVGEEGDGWGRWRVGGGDGEKHWEKWRGGASAESNLEHGERGCEKRKKEETNKRKRGGEKKKVALNIYTKYVQSQTQTDKKTSFKISAAEGSEPSFARTPSLPWQTLLNDSSSVGEDRRQWGRFLDLPHTA